MTCLLLDSVAGLSTDNPLRARALRGTPRTATPTSGPTGGGTSASSASAAASHSQAREAASHSNAGSAVRTCKGACARTLPLTAEFFYRCTDESRDPFRPKCIECMRDESRARRPAAKRFKHDTEGGLFPALPVAPLARRIREEIEHESELLRPWLGSRIGVEGLAPGSVKRVCDRIGVTTDCYRKWASGQTACVDFDVADAVLLAGGWLWWEVWSRDDPVACRAFNGEGQQQMQMAMEAAPSGPRVDLTGAKFLRSKVDYPEHAILKGDGIYAREQSAAPAGALVVGLVDGRAVVTRNETGVHVLGRVLLIARRVG